MAKKNETPKLLERDVIIVGGGPAGLLAAQSLKAGSQSVCVIEASEGSGGRARSALHLLNADHAGSFPILTGSLLGPARVRWERRWVDASQVDWSEKDWIGQLPQWDLLFGSNKVAYLDFGSAELPVETFYRSAVSRLDRTQEGGRTLWRLETPDREFVTPRLIWAAGLIPFQNALGKQDAQEYLAPNPSYKLTAADFRGGVALDADLGPGSVLDPTIDRESLFAIPFRFEGKLHLMVGLVQSDAEGTVGLRTLTHASQDLLGDPKTVLSFQKALRRALKSLAPEESEFSLKNERWVVSDRILGHSLGMPWLLRGANVADSSILFVGDETLTAIESGSNDTLGALRSVLARCVISV